MLTGVVYMHAPVRGSHSRLHSRLNVHTTLQGGFFGEAAFMMDRVHICDFVALGHTWPIGRYRPTHQVFSLRGNKTSWFEV